ncbi:hypothetical protein DWX93_16800, partial [Roseburia hominis]
KLLRNFRTDFSISFIVVTSRRQLIYYIIVPTVCQQLFYFLLLLFQKPLLSVLLILRDNSFIISCIEAYVNNFFRKKLNNSYLQIKRRRRDLNPRAG